MAETADLGAKINAHIATAGPISISTYMRLCLTHPTLGYYKNTDPLGAKGDFITAPEVSQLFGEMIGIWIANTWQEMGAPKTFDLVELGPGRGTLMADALRVLETIPGITEALRLVLIETNHALIEKQRVKLTDFYPEWATELSALDGRHTPIVMIANEFFDALPIKQFEKRPEGWHERLVGVTDNKRQIGLSSTPLPNDIAPKELSASKEGAILEQSPVSTDVITEIAQKLAARRGALLAIDYGYTKTQTGNTFQAIENHKFADPLANPGKADLTAHVNFEALANAASAHARAMPVLTQAIFLKAMGIEQRHANLTQTNPDHMESLNTDLNRLIADDEMGNLFKCLCVSSQDLTPYPFSPEER